MRYTTIIDISEYPKLYRNANIRLVYLHLVLKAGYHDIDRDVIDLSPRRIARETGLTYAAVRHAMEVLRTVGLVTMDGTVQRVRKYVTQLPITPRPKTEAAQTAAKIRVQEEEEKMKREKYLQEQQRRTQELREQGKTQYMVYFESLIERAEKGDEEAKQLVHQHMPTYLAHQALIEKESKENAQ